MTRDSTSTTEPKGPNPKHLAIQRRVHAAIKNRADALDIGSTQLGRLIDVPQSSAHKYMNGTPEGNKMVGPALVVLPDIARALDTTVYDILIDAEVIEPPALDFSKLISGTLEIINGTLNTRESIVKTIFSLMEAPGVLDEHARSIAIESFKIALEMSTALEGRKALTAVKEDEQLSLVPDPVAAPPRRGRPRKDASLKHAS